jgi:hypothetical protein
LKERAIYKRLGLKTTKYAAVFASTFYSQVLAAANLGLVWFLGPAAADAYTIGIQVSTFSYAGFVLGVVYLVALGRPSFNNFFGFKVAAGCLAGIAAIFGILAMLRNPAKFDEADYLTLLLFGIGGAFLAIKTVSLVGRACSGEPQLLTRITILPNVMLATGFLALFGISRFSDGHSYIPALLWLLGSVIVFQKRYQNKSASKNFPSETLPVSRLDPHSHLSQTLLLSLGVITSNVLPFVYIFALTGLEDGTMALSFLLLRVVSSGVYLMSHTFLATNLNWKDGLRLPPTFEIWGSGLVLALSLSSLVLANSADSLAGVLLALVALGVSLFFSTAYLREVNRLRLQVVLGSKVFLDLAISAGCALILVINPSTLGLIVVVLISQCVTIAVCGFGLRKFFVSLANMVVVISAIGILVK